MKPFFAIITMCLLCVGCSHTRYVTKEVPVEVTKVEYQNVYVRDSIHMTDSVLVYLQGDTVFKEIHKLQYISRISTDTLIRHDTIPQIITQQQVVEKKVPQWWPVWLCGILLLLGFLFYLYLTKKLKFK